MKKIREVEEAKDIMTEAQNWGVWRWLTEKRKVRLTADACNDALARAEKKTIEAWPDEMREAYAELESAKKRHSKKIDHETIELVRKIKEAIDEAERVRLDAEDIFDRADRALSTSMAKDGTRRAIEAWELREKAIRKAESAGKAHATA
jgi:predicted phage gp36 major capsid-like protein